MRLLSRLFGRQGKKNPLSHGTAGAVFAKQAPVGVRKENGVFLAVRRGIAASAPRKKSKKLLRREKGAMWLARVREKQFGGAA